MVLDAVSNFVRGRVSAPVATSDTTVSVEDASIFPDPATDGEYNVVIWDANNFPRPDQDSDVEIMRVTARDTGADELTVVRGQETTSAVAHPEGSAVHLSPTAKMFSDIESTFADFWDSGTQELTADVNNESVNTEGTRIGNHDDAKAIIEDAEPYERFIADTRETIETDEIVISSEGVELIGFDLKLAEQGQNLLSIQADDVSVRKCKLDGDSDPDEDESSGQDALLFIGGDNEVSGVEVSHCFVRDSADSAIGVGTDTRGDDLKNAYDIDINRCFVTGFGDDGITLHRTFNSTVRNCYAWGGLGLPGNTAGFEIEWGTANTTIKNCFAWDNPVNEDDISGHNYIIKAGGGDLPYNVTFDNCYALGDTRFQFNIDAGDITSIEDGIEQTNDPVGIKLNNCVAVGDAYLRVIRVRGYEVVISGGRYEHQSEESTGRSTIESGGGFDSDVTLTGAVHYVDTGDGFPSRELRVEDASHATIYDSTFDIERASRPAVRVDDGATARIDGLETNANIEVNDDGRVDLESAEFNELDPSDSGTIVIKNGSIVADLSMSGLEPEEGAQAFDEGSGEPAFGDGDDWRSVVSGDVI